jgi:hypothetical protein
MTFQARSWLAERLGWAAMALLVLLGLGGLFASGPVSTATARNADGTVAVDYERFARKTARAHFSISVAAATSDTTSIRLGRSFLDYYDIEVLKPQAVRERSGRSGLELDFAAAATGDVVVEISARSRHFGIVTFNVDVAGRDGVKIRQVIYP